MLKLSQIEAALQCALPVLDLSLLTSSIFPAGSAFAVERRGRLYVVTVDPPEKVAIAAGATSKRMLALRRLPAEGPLAIFAAERDPDLRPLLLDDAPPAEGEKLLLRGFVRERARLDFDDGTHRWQAFAGTARASAPGELKLDEPDSVASMDGLAGAPVFTLREGRFTGAVLSGEKKSVVGRATLADAATITTAIDRASACG